MSPEEQFGHILALLSQNSKGITELKLSMSEMKAAKEDLDAWKPEVDHRVADLEQAVNHLNECVEKLYHHSVNSAKSLTLGEGKVEHPEPDPSKARKSEVSGSVHLGPTPSRATSGLLGHRNEHHHWSAGFGVVYTTLTLPSVIGAMNQTKPPPIPIGSDDSVYRDRRVGSHINSAMPNTIFPQFDGSNPSL